MKKFLLALGLAACLTGYLGPAHAASTQAVSGLEVYLGADYDKDGKVSLQEHLAWARGAFEQMDLAGKGFITKQDAAQLQANRLASLAHEGESDGIAAPAPVLVGAFEFPPGLDSDGDGKVTLAEHLAWETESFRKSDLDGDGFITAKEIVAKKKMAQVEVELRTRLLREQSAKPKTQETKLDYQK